MIDYINARRTAADDIVEALDDVRAELRHRTAILVAGREVGEPYELVLHYADEVLRDERVAGRVAEIARLGRKPKIRIHLVTSRVLDKLTLFDFGNAILRDMASHPDTGVTITDCEGTTLSDLMHA